MLRRYVLLGTSAAVLEELNLRSSALAPMYLMPDPAHSSLKTRTRQLIQQAEAHVILQVLQEHNWNRSKSARSLNISLRGLLYKMRAAALTNTVASGKRSAHSFEDTIDPISPVVRACLCHLGTLVADNQFGL